MLVDEPSENHWRMRVVEIGGALKCTYQDEGRGRGANSYYSGEETIS